MLPSPLGGLDNHRRRRVGPGDQHAAVPARHRPGLERHRVRRRQGPHRGAEDRRLVHGRKDQYRRPDHPPHAARRHQQGLRPDARAGIDPQRGRVLAGIPAVRRKMGAPEYLLAIDQGTTSTSAILFDATGGIHHTARVALRQIHPQPGWVEHDPEEIWRAVVATCHEAIAAARGHPIAAIGIANQRETTVLWDRTTGRPVHNAIVWQDRRTAPLCQSWREAGLSERVQSRTGLVIDPYFSASKIRWLLDNVTGLRERAKAGEIAFGTIDSFLLWRLTGGLHTTDVTNASRTMLFDLHRLAWDDELLREFGMPRALLPEVRDTDANFGAALPELFGDAIPITGMAGDQHAALMGEGCFSPGRVKSTYGTSTFALLHPGSTPAVSRNRLLT